MRLKPGIAGNRGQLIRAKSPVLARYGDGRGPFGQALELAEKARSVLARHHPANQVQRLWRALLHLGHGMGEGLRRGDIMTAVEPDLRVLSHMSLQGAAGEVLQPGRPACRLQPGRESRIGDAVPGKRVDSG